MQLKCSRSVSIHIRSILKGVVCRSSRRCALPGRGLGPQVRTVTRDVSMRNADVPVATVQPSASSSVAAASVPITPLYTGKKAVVVGAGPAGSTAAMYLARQGFQVDVYEKRPEPVSDVVDGGRAYIIILIPRGRAALQELGVELPRDPHFITKGSVRHRPNGKVSIVKEEGNVTFSRSDLAQFLIDTARSMYPDHIRFHFSQEMQELELEGRKATFSSASGPTTVSYDLLVGADGAGSKVRAALASHLPGYTVDVNDSGREYKVYLNLKGDIEPPEFRGSAGATLHLWTADKDPFTTFTAHSNPDGTYSGTFSMRTGGFSALSSQGEYEEVLRNKFSGVPQEWVPEVAAQAFAGQASPAGKRIRCSQLGAPGVVLLGDAAHAVTPVFGQGANSGLESCSVLGQALQAAGGKVEEVPAVFDAARKPDAHALYEIDRKAYSFFSKKDPLDFLQLLSHVLLGTILSKVMPFLYGRQPLLLQLGSAPYSRILSAVERDSAAAAVLLAGLLAFVACKIAGLL